MQGLIQMQTKITATNWGWYIYLHQWLCYESTPGRSPLISGSSLASPTVRSPWVSQTRRREVAEYFGPFLPNDMAFCRSYLEKPWKKWGISHWNMIFVKMRCYLISDIKSAIVGQELFVDFEWTKSIFTGYSISSMLFLALKLPIHFHTKS